MAPIVLSLFKFEHVAINFFEFVFSRSEKPGLSPVFRERTIKFCKSKRNSVTNMIQMSWALQITAYFTAI